MKKCIQYLNKGRKRDYYTSQKQIKNHWNIQIIYEGFLKIDL